MAAGDKLLLDSSSGDNLLQEYDAITLFAHTKTKKSTHHGDAQTRRLGQRRSRIRGDDHRIRPRHRTLVRVRPAFVPHPQPRGVR